MKLARIVLMAWALAGAAFESSAAPLAAGAPIALAGTHGRFDFIRIDASGNRLLLGHEENKTFDVFDLEPKKLLKTVSTGTAQDAATDEGRGRYYVSGNDPGRMVIVDAKSLEITGEVPVPANTDLIAFNPKTGLVYECNDTAAEVWVIDPDAKKITATIKLEGRGVEDLAFDPDYEHLYQAVKGANAIAEIDPKENKVISNWPLAPETGPHGIAIVPDGDGLLVACSGKLVLLNRRTGKILSTAETGSRVDEMAYDPGLHLAYCASRKGEISVAAVGQDKLTSLGGVADEATGSIAVDSKTHTVWIAYQKGGNSYVQPFEPTK